MTEPIDRRRFIGHSLAAAIALEIAANTSLAASTVEALLAQADPRLIPDVPAAPVEQNGYYLLERLAKGISEGPPYDPLTDGAWEYEDAFSPVKPDAARDLKLGKWADENPAAVDRIIEALRKPRCEYPREEYSDGLTDKLSAFRSLARLMTVKATRSLSRGDCEGAARIVEHSADAFRRLRLGGGFYVDYLVASACEFSLRPLSLKIAADAHCDEKLLRAMLSAHPVDSESKAGLARCFQSEYCLYLIPELAKYSKCDARDLATTLNPRIDSITSAEEYEREIRLVNALIAGHSHPFDEVETAKLASDRSLATLADLELPWRVHRKKPEFVFEELKPWPRPLSLNSFYMGDISKLSDREIEESRKQLLGVHNPVGKKLVEDSAIYGKGAHLVALREQARYDGVRIMLALALYEKRHGEWPASLERLSAEGLLERLPRDVFSDEAYQYSAEECVLWSVGADGKLSPKSSEGNLLEAEELIWRLPTRN